MTANNSKSYLAYLNKLVDQNNDTYHHSNGKNLLMMIIETKKIETNHKASKFNVTDKVRITKYKHIFSKGYTKNRSREFIYY